MINDLRWTVEPLSSINHKEINSSTNQQKITHTII